MNEDHVQSARKMNNSDTEIRDLIVFLNKINASFPVPLSEKIQIEEYAQKVLLLGIVIKIEHNNEIVGVVTGYANNNVSGGYISVLGVSENHRGQKIGSRLLEAFIDEAKIEGMKQISLFAHKDNHNALKMYLNRGFFINNSINKNYDYDIALTLDITP